MHQSHTMCFSVLILGIQEILTVSAISTVTGIIHGVCKAIWTSLMDEVLPVPTAEDWATVAKDFKNEWQFPNCLGAIDGKHVQIKAPKNSRSLFFNYKKTYSIACIVFHRTSKGKADGASTGNFDEGQKGILPSTLLIYYAVLHYLLDYIT